MKIYKTKVIMAKINWKNNKIKIERQQDIACFIISDPRQMAHIL